MMIKTTRAQREALKRVFDRWKPAKSYREWRKTCVHGYFGDPSCIIVDVGTMWLGIEKDGYTHS